MKYKGKHLFNHCIIFILHQQAKMRQNLSQSQNKQDNGNLLQKKRVTSLLLCAFWMLPGCSVSSIPVNFTATPNMVKSTSTAQSAANISTIEKYARIKKMPSSASNLVSRVDIDEQGSAVFLRFDLPRNDLDQFLVDAGYEGKTLVKDQFAMPAKSIEWWPDIKTYKASYRGANLITSQFGRWIMVEDKDAQTVTVYLEHIQL